MGSTHSAQQPATRSNPTPGPTKPHSGLTSLFPSLSNYLLRDPPPAGQGAQQFELGHDGEVVTDCGSQFIEEEPQTLDDGRADLLVGTALLLVRLPSHTGRDRQAPDGVHGAGGRDAGPTHLNEGALGLVDDPAHVHHGLGQRPVLHLLDAQRAGVH